MFESNYKDKIWLEAREAVIESSASQWQMAADLCPGEGQSLNSYSLPTFDIQEDYTLCSNRSRTEWANERQHNTKWN